MSVVGLAIDWVEALADAVDDPEARPAGFAEPHYPVSPQVTVSRDHGLYVYHLADDQLGQGSSFGNARAWAETKGTGDMLGLYSVDVGARVLGGLSLTYLLPFSDLSDGTLTPQSQTVSPSRHHDRYARVMPTARGAIHLHPAYQQREFVIGDGLHVLETFFLPRTGMDDPAAAHAVVALRNRTPHPLRIIVVASLDLRGATPHDMVARFDAERGALVACNASRPEWVRAFGASTAPAHYCATTDEERAYSPGGPLSDRTVESGDLTGALQYDLLLLPGQRHKLRLTAAFSTQGSDAALHTFDAARHHHHALRETIAQYTSILETATVEMPDALLSQAVQWAKTCLLRPVSRYALGDGVTNDPGRSTRLVGRDTAWYVHGCDYVMPELSCRLLRAFAQTQRADGLIMEYVDGRTGETEDHGFNINDNTPLFVMAVAHHARVRGHEECLRDLYEPARRAAEAVLAARDERGLVRCNALGSGIAGICGWRNIMQHERISGVVTEVNAESYAALGAMANLAGQLGCVADAQRFRDAAEQLRAAINGALLDPRTGLYVRNIDAEGRVFTQATIDLVFPLMLGVAAPEVAQRITARLALPDFMTPGGIRAVPEENPRYDPSFEYGLLGGVWPGATWWYALGSARTDPAMMAASLRASYWHYVADPKVYNTVPGQFSEWSDGQTLVNRGMRLSPWEAPRFLWAVIEGVLGLSGDADGLTLEPHLPADWQWLRAHNLPHRDEQVSFFLTRQGDRLHLYTCGAFAGDLVQHRYDEELARGVEAITTGVSMTAFRGGAEVVICLGNSLDVASLGPFLAHHALEYGTTYRVARLTSLNSEWCEIGTIKGSELQRIMIRLEPRGYALYRFAPGGAPDL